MKIFGIKGTTDETSLQPICFQGHLWSNIRLNFVMFYLMKKLSVHYEFALEMVR